MNGMIACDEVIGGVGQWTVWWVTQRMGKLREEAHHTMSVNPFLAPILFELHHAKSFADLGELLLAGHLMVGHTTGFGKLVDEKLLPNVFGTHKLSTVAMHAGNCLHRTRRHSTTTTSITFGTIARSTGIGSSPKSTSERHPTRCASHRLRLQAASAPLLLIPR